MAMAAEIAAATAAAADDGYDAIAIGEERLSKLSAKFEREGLDLDFLGAEFLEFSELGSDAAALRQRFGKLPEEERRRLFASVDQQGRTGLLLAAQKGDEDVVNVLLDAGANPNHGDNAGATALHYAASRGATAVVKSLLFACAEAQRCDDEGEDPLFWARGAEVVATLVQAGADVGKVSSQCRTALMRAAGRGDLATVEALARTPGVDLNFTDGRGVCARRLAEEAGYEEVAQLLVQLGATPAAEAGAPGVLDVQEALLAAARRGDAGGCEALLRDHGARVDAEQASGETALLAAAAAGSLAAADVLLQARADPNLPERFLEETPLLRAVLSAGNAPEMLWLLLEARADPCRGDRSGRTPLGVAESWGKEDAAEILRAAVAGELPLDGLD